MIAKQQRSFKGVDIASFVKKISSKYKMEWNVLYGDNAKINSCHIVRDTGSKEDVDFMFNVPYRPDLNGIERVWKIAKHRYRNEVAKLMVTRQNIDNLKLVKKVLADITDQQCSE
jgi:transposase